MALGRPAGRGRAAVPRHRGVRRAARRGADHRRGHRLPGVRDRRRRPDLDRDVPQRRPGRVLRLHDVLRPAARPGAVRPGRRQVPDPGHRRRRPELAVRPTAGMPAALAGEFAFAASGTCLVSRRRRGAWFATGGGARAAGLPHPRRRRGLERSPTRRCPSGPSAGIYSLAFRDRVARHRGRRRLRDPDGRAGRRRDHPGRRPHLDGRRGRCRASTAPAPPGSAGTGAALRGRPDRQRLSLRRRPHLDGGSTPAASTRSQCAGDGACWASGEQGRVAKLRWR